MLVLNDKCLLGDKVLDLKEANIAAKEENDRRSAKFKIPDQKMLEDEKAARGWELPWQEFVRRLTKMPSRLPVLIMKGGMDNAIAVRVVKRNSVGEEEKEYVTGFYMELMPEFSSVTVDEHGLPKRENRGWRSVLLALVRAGALDPTHVEVTFGPATGQRSCLWARSLQTLR